MLCFTINVSALADTAKSAILINGNTMEVVYQHNAYEKLPMASTTKIMTALMLAEQPDLEKRIICTKQMVTVEGSSMGLLEGDSVSYEDLLYGILLASGNDAANTTAIALGGSISNFVDAMNLKARSMGLHSTNFVTPSGLDADEHYSTAYDMSVLATSALKNEIFKTACSSYTKTLFYGNPPYRRTLTNHNKLLKNYDGLIGVKTGYTKKSGRCLVTAAERDGALLVAVTLSDKNDWQSHRNMLDFGFSSLETIELSANLDDNEVSVVGGLKDSVAVKTENIFVKMLPENRARILTKIYLPKEVVSPIKAGDVVGKVKYYLDDSLIASSDITAEEDVEKKKDKTYSEKFKASLKGILLKI